MKYMLRFIIGVLLLPATSLAGEISSVTIRDKNFAVIKVLSDETSMPSFNGYWNKKAKMTDDVPMKPLYMIDIPPGHRWLYDPAGYVRVLSKAKVPIYQISSPGDFNKLLGISESDTKAGAR